MRSIFILALAALPVFAGEFSTFIGDTSEYHVARIRADAAGNTYIAGNRSSDSAFDGFVMKLDPSGNIVVFNTFSGKGMDTINDLAVDAAGNFYVAGSTNSQYLPLRSAFQSKPGPGFIVKLSPDGEQILFSTYFPAAIQALAVDAAGNVFVTGTTDLPSFPLTPGMPAGLVLPGQDFGAFITKLAATGDHILYSGLVSGNAKNCGCCSSCFTSARHAAGVAVAVDASGNAYVAGDTDTSDLPTTSGALLGKGGTGAFVMKVNAAGSGLAYLTYVGATAYPLSPNANPANTATSIAVDAAGDAYLTGSTSDPHFPATNGAYQTTYNGASTASYPQPPTDAFVLKLNPSGTAAVWASYLGGSGADSPSAIAVDTVGNTWIVGTTASADFPNAQGWSQGSDFVAEFNATGSALPYAGRYPAGSVSQSVGLDGAGLVHVAGAAGLVSALTSAGTPLMRIFGVANAAYGAVTGQIVEGEVIAIYGPHIGPAKPVTAIPDSNGVLSTALAGVQVLVVDGTTETPLPLLYVSDSQINAAVPFDIYGSTGLRVVNVATSSPIFPVALVDADPEIFRNPAGSAAEVNQDGTINSAANPAPLGSIVSIWLTGAGLADEANWGRISMMARNTNCCSVMFGNMAAYVPYGGDAPGAVGGIVQVNFQVPPLPQYDILDGVTEFTVEAGGVVSHPAVIHVSSGPAAAHASN